MGWREILKEIAVSLREGYAQRPDWRPLGCLLEVVYRFDERNTCVEAAVLPQQGLDLAVEVNGLHASDEEGVAAIVKASIHGAEQVDHRVGEER